MTDDLVQVDADVPAGEIVGEYRVERKLGEGGFGAVYLATHPVIGKQVAIKVLHRRYSADPQIVSRFVSEARAVNQIRHRNIIDIFGFGKLPDGRHYYVMELLDGAPLDRLLAARERLELAEAVPLLRGIARALDAAHKKGIAHRDLKPENVFLENDGDGVTPKLLDFGVAKLLHDGPDDGDGPEHKTETGVRIGTPHYMSPEQCRGRGVDHRTDIYAFGVLVFRVLTGKLPFTGADSMEVVLQHLQSPPPKVSEHAPVPAALDTPVQWMMQKDPARRPANLATALMSLEQAGRGAGLSLPALTPSPDDAPLASLTPPPLVSAETRLERPAPAASTTLESSVGETGRAAPRSSRARLVTAVAITATVLALAAYAIVWNGSPSSTPDAAPIAATIPPPSPPPPPKSAPAPAPASASDPAPPPSVTLHLSGTPGAEVWHDGSLRGHMPVDLTLPRGTTAVELRIVKPGYAERLVVVVPDADRAERVVLSRKRVKGPKNGKPLDIDRTLEE